jgi:uncharacterized protein YutE (UPF0331/DUF86 family)
MSEFDVVLSKISVIKNCIMSIEKASQIEKDPDFLLAIYELNLQRAIQASINLANVIIAKEGLGLPNTYKQSFEILLKHGIIMDDICKKLCSMVGFRNISVHDYQKIRPEIIQSIIKNHLTDFEHFYAIVLKYSQAWNTVG